jgi:hypothetical protein
MILRMNDIQFEALIKQIVYLKNLTKLDLILRFEGNSSKKFIESLKSIAINCNQLKSSKFSVSETDISHNKQIFNSLGFFKNLNVLDLSFYKYNEENNEISCESLKELKLLMNLILKKHKMNDIFFEDIDKHLSQLKHLDILVDKKTTDKAMN